MDNLVITGDHKEKISKVKRLLTREFHMSDLRALHYFLGTENRQYKGDIFICQERSCRDLPGWRIAKRLLHH